MDQRIPSGSIVIPPEKLYEEVIGTRHDLTELRGEIRDLLRQVPDHENRIRALEQRDDGDDVARGVQDHESRLRNVERRIWLVAGGAAAAAAGLTKAISAALGG